MTARTPAPNAAKKGGIKRRDITTMEINAAIPQARRAFDHSIPVESAEGLRTPGTPGASEENIGRTLVEAPPAITGTAPSGGTTRICGAPHCEQKGLPSSTLCPHLKQGWSIGNWSRTRLKVSYVEEQK